MFSLTPICRPNPLLPHHLAHRISFLFSGYIWFSKASFPSMGTFAFPSSSSTCPYPGFHSPFNSAADVSLLQRLWGVSSHAAALLPTTCSRKYTNNIVRVHMQHVSTNITTKYSNSYGYKDILIALKILQIDL